MNISLQGQYGWIHLTTYYNLGKRDLAVKQYKILEAKLKNELDIAPLPETVFIYKQLLQDERKAQPVVSPNEIKPDLFHENARLSLTGRKEELFSLFESFKKLEKLEGNVIFVNGNAGIGKTRLITEFLERIKDKTYILHSKCFENQKSLGYHPVVNAFRIFFQKINYKISVDSAYLRDLVILFPEMEGLFNLTPYSFLSLPELRSRLFESFYRLLLSFSERHPLVLSMRQKATSVRARMNGF